MNIEEDVNDILVKLAPSTPVFVELVTPAGQKNKFKTRYVGFVPSQFILLQLPDLFKNQHLSLVLHECAHCTVRTVIEGHEGMIIAFQSDIQFTVKSPASMLVLAPPKKIAVQHLRKVTRIETDMTVEVKLGNQYFDGVVLNLSPLGCLLSVQSVGDNADLKDGVELSFKTTDERYANPGRIKGTICSLKPVHDDQHLGIEFDNGSREGVMTLINQVLFGGAQNMAEQETAQPAEPESGKTVNKAAENNTTE